MPFAGCEMQRRSLVVVSEVGACGARRGSRSTRFAKHHGRQLLRQPLRCSTAHQRGKQRTLDVVHRTQLVIGTGPRTNHVGIDESVEHGVEKTFALVA